MFLNYKKRYQRKKIFISEKYSVIYILLLFEGQPKITKYKYV